MDNSNQTFDLDDLVLRLRNAAARDTAGREVKAILQEAVQNPDQVQMAMPDFEEDEAILFEDGSISVWFCRFRPGTTVPPHDHQMIATIGVYSGAERNDFFENDPAGTIRKSNEVVLGAGNVLQIGPNAIHAVGCASEEPSCAIHVYLGRLTEVDRSLFDIPNGETLKFTDENYNRLASQD